MSQNKPKNIPREVFEPKAMNRVWEWDGKKYEFNCLDADDQDKLENALNKLKANETLIPKDGRNSDTIRVYVEMLRDVFRDVFDEKSSDDIIGTKADLDRAQRAYLSFLGFVDQQKNDGFALNSSANYLNRADRRANAKKNAAGSKNKYAEKKTPDPNGGK